MDKRDRTEGVEESIEDSEYLGRYVTAIRKLRMETLAQESSNASWTKNVDGVGFNLEGRRTRRIKRKFLVRRRFTTQAVLPLERRKSGRLD